MPDLELPTRRARRTRSCAMRATKAWRRRQVENCRCSTCGKPMPEADLRTECPGCRRHHVARNAYARHFLRDFT